MKLTVHSAGRSRDLSNLVLAQNIVQAMIGELLPAALRMLGEVLYPAQLPEKNARFQAYKGAPSSGLRQQHTTDFCAGSLLMLYKTCRLG